MDDLKIVFIGFGIGWLDMVIFCEVGLMVEDVKYDNLFKMVDWGWIDGFVCGVVELFSEVEVCKDDMLNLVIDESVMIVYLFDLFFFFNKDDIECYDIFV